jgi:hypothetical protein
MLSWKARRSCRTSASLPPITSAHSPLVMPSRRITTTSSPSIVVRTCVGPRPVYRETTCTTAVEIAAESSPCPLGPSREGPLQRGEGMSPQSRFPQRRRSREAERNEKNLATTLLSLLRGKPGKLEGQNYWRGLRFATAAVPWLGFKEACPRLGSVGLYVRP